MAEKQKQYETKGYELIGRSREIGKIVEIANRVDREKRTAGILVIGEEGIGRSAFLNFASKKISLVTPSFLTIGPIVFKSIISPFFPVDQIIMELLKLKMAGKKTEDEVMKSIENRLEELGISMQDSEMVHHRKILSELVLSTSRKKLVIEEGEEEDEGEKTSPVEKYLYSIRRILSLIAEKKNLALIFDDLERYPIESRGLMRALRIGLGGKPVLWVLASDIPLQDLEQIYDEQILLLPLSKEDTANFLKESFQDLAPFPEELIDLLYSLSKGKPGLLNHHIGILIENRVLELSHEGKWIFNPNNLIPENLPIDRDALLELKLSGLDDSQREVLTLASAVGDVFWDDAVLALKRALKGEVSAKNPAMIWPDDSEILSIQATLESLCNQGFCARLESQEFYGVAEYTFLQDGMREKLFSRIEPEKQKFFNLQVASWLEVISGNRRWEYGEVIGRRLEIAGEKEIAALYYMEAARLAKSRFLHERAYELFKKSIEAMNPRETSLVLECLHEMGNMAQALGRLDEALECFEKMLRVAWRVVSRSKAGAALNKIGRIYRQRGDFRAARAFFERSLSLFTHCGDERGISSTRDDLGTIEFLVGNYDRAMELYNDALTKRMEMKDLRGIALSYEHIGQIHRANGSYEEAEKYARQALEIRRQINDGEGIVSSLNFLGILAYEKGKNEGAISIWKEALEYAVKISNLRMMEYLNNNIGELLMEMDKNEAAESYFKQSIEIATILSDRRAESEICKNLGLLYTKSGNVKSAREFLNRSISIAKETGSKEQMGVALRALGQLEGFSIFDEGGVAGAAESYFHEALDIFKGIGNENEYLRTMEVYSKYLFDHGRVEEAISLLEKAVSETSVKSKEVIERLKSSIKKMKQFSSS